MIDLIPIASHAATVSGAGVDITALTGNVTIVCNTANVSGTLPTLEVVLESTPGAGHITSAIYTGTGNGHIEVTAGPDPVAETIVFTASSATAFAVVGGTSGALGTATVGTRFITPQVSALITAGSVAYTATGHWDVITTARTWTATDVTFTATDAATSATALINVDPLGAYLRATATLDGTDPVYLISCGIA